MKALNAHFDILTSYLEMNKVGRLMAKGAGYPETIKPSYLKKLMNFVKIYNKMDVKL